MAAGVDSERARRADKSDPRIRIRQRLSKFRRHGWRGRIKGHQGAEGDQPDPLVSILQGGDDRWSRLHRRGSHLRERPGRDPPSPGVLMSQGTRETRDNLLGCGTNAGKGSTSPLAHHRVGIIQRAEQRRRPSLSIWAHPHERHGARLTHLRVGCAQRGNQDGCCLLRMSMIDGLSHRRSDSNL